MNLITIYNYKDGDTNYFNMFRIWLMNAIKCKNCCELKFMPNIGNCLGNCLGNRLGNCLVNL